MCGILGEFSFKKKLTFQKKFKSIRDLMKLRGPDDKGYSRLNNRLQFGFRRLSIIDLKSRSNQPFKNLKTGSAIIFNGEIYNYQDIKKKLKLSKVNFSTTSDTEVILKLYENYGINGLKNLRGMFAFAIWDNKKKRFSYTEMFMALSHFIFIDQKIISLFHQV